jgi:hypothetical protein
MSTIDLQQRPTMVGGEQAWAAAWRRALPIVALIGPGSWFLAALVRAAGLGTLDGELGWISAPEGVIMALGVSWFAATYVLLALTNFVNFAAWLVAGIAILRTSVVPRWIGVACIGGVVAILLGQGAYVALEFFWPVGTGLWLAATAGVARARHADGHAGDRPAID